MPAIETEDLRKTYVSHKKSPGIAGAVKGLLTREKTEVEAVKGISISVQQGELVGFLGPNGAGKTTTLKMLSGILHPTSGRATVLGFKPSERKPEMLRQISLVMGNKNQLWWDLPAWDSFLVLRELYEVEHVQFKRRVDHLIEALQIGDKINIQVRKLSLGERMKCELVAALLHAPKVVFLDEPTIGLDVVSQKRIRDFLKELNATDNCSILLTSHYMQDVQELCERIIVIDKGATIFEGTLKQLSHRFSDARKLRLTFENEVEPEALREFGNVLLHEGAVVVIEVPHSKIAVVTGAILSRFPVSDVSIQEIEADEIIRDLFTSANVPRGTSEAKVTST